MLPYRSLRHIGRARHVGAVLVKYGLGHLISRLGLRRLLPVRRWRVSGGYGGISTAERVRLALEELGPTGVKLGQVLSTRSDIIPEGYLRELRRLQDHGLSVPFEQIKQTIEKEFKQPLDSLFSSFEPEPLACASIGQVHRATLNDGEGVIVKVQRPGVDAIVEADQGIIADIAAMLHLRVPSLRRYDLPGFAREFRSVMHDELVYTIEGHNADTLRELLAKEDRVHVPRVYWDRTSRCVLTLEYLDGNRIDNLEEIDKQGLDRKDLAARLARSILSQIFVHSIFHADPHQGNVWVLRDGRLALLDLGMMGRLDEQMRRGLVEMLLAVFRRDADGLLEQLAEIGVVGEGTDSASLRRDLSRLLARYYFLSRSQMPLGELFNRVITLMFHHDVRLPTEFPLMAKALVVTEGICRELDPDFDFHEAAKPVVARLKAEYFSPARLAGEFLDTVNTFRRHVVTLPTRLNRVLTAIDRGALKVRAMEEDADRRLARQSALANRVCLSILLAAVGVGSVIIVLSPSVSATAKLWVAVPVVALFAISILALLAGSLRLHR